MSYRADTGHEQKYVIQYGTQDVVSIYMVIFLFLDCFSPLLLLSITNFKSSWKKGQTIFFGANSNTMGFFFWFWQSASTLDFDFLYLLDIFKYVDIKIAQNVFCLFLFIFKTMCSC